MGRALRSTMSTCIPIRAAFSRRISRIAQQPRAEDSTINSAPVDSTREQELEALDPESGSVVVKPSFNLAASFLFSGGAMAYLGDFWAVLGFPIILIGTLLSVQTVRLRFIFGPKRISVAQRKNGGLDIIRGWEYDKISNWEVWWKVLPILAYFKEKESYNGRGSVHFFPVLCDGAQLIEQFRTRVSHIDKSNYT